MSGRVDDALLAEAVAGDALALQKLLWQNFPQLERHVAARIPPEHRSLIAAEDILQETFCQAFRDFCKIQRQQAAEFPAWLRSVAEHRLADAVKALNRKKRGGGLRRVERVRDSSSAVQLVERICGGSRTPTRSIARREAAQAVQVHVASLPEDQREAIRGRYFDGLEVVELAARMGRSPGAVRGLLHRAQQRLAELLGGSSRWMDR